MLNLPQKVTMSNNRFVKYKYSATGNKLQAIYSVSGLKLIQPMSKVMSDRSGNDDTLSSSDINLGASLSDSFADPSTSGSSQNIYGLPVLDYCGNIVYSDKEPVKILFDGGYVSIKKGSPLTISSFAITLATYVWLQMLMVNWRNATTITLSVV